MALSTGRRSAHVVMPNETLREIDARVGQRQRSECIREAIDEKLGRLRRVEALERVVDSVVDGDVPEWETREATVGWLRALCKESGLLTPRGVGGHAYGVAIAARCHRLD